MPRPPGPVWDQGPKGPRDWLSHIAKKPVLVATDRGWFGRTPLDLHIVICGFPRSGSTVLQLVLETCLADARGTHGEMDAIRVARMILRNHRVLISKRPKDLYHIDRTRAYYGRKRAEVRFLITTRDPRDLLTSVHKARPDEYYVSPDSWDQMYAHLAYQQSTTDCLVVRYEDFVSKPDSAESDILQFTGQVSTLPFRRYHERPVHNQNAIALNGLRPLTPANVGRWRADQHRDRLRAVLGRIPDFPEKVVAMGYEADTTWATEYR